MGRDIALERSWRKREYERSGLTIRHFCEREGLVAHQFSWWRSELKRRDAKSASLDKRASQKKSSRRRKRADPPSASASGRFVLVDIQPSSRGDAAIEIILDQPPRVRVSSGFDAELLREVVRVLERLSYSVYLLRSRYFSTVRPLTCVAATTVWRLSSRTR